MFAPISCHQGLGRRGNSRLYRRAPAAGKSDAFPVGTAETGPAAPGQVPHFADGKPARSHGEWHGRAARWSE
jgi:hypothetical protein